MLLRLEHKTDGLALLATAALLLTLGLPRLPAPVPPVEQPASTAMEMLLEEPAETVVAPPGGAPEPEPPPLELPPPEEPPPVEMTPPELPPPPPPVEPPPVPVAVPPPPPPTPRPPTPRPPMPPRPPRPLPPNTPTEGPTSPTPGPVVPNAAASAAAAAASVEGSYVAQLRGYLSGIAAQRYPTSREARMQRPMGDVIVKLRLSRSGELLEAVIFRPATSPILNQQALQIVRSANFAALPFPAEAWPGEAAHEFNATLGFMPP
jgi:protein TonB